MSFPVMNEKCLKNEGKRIDQEKIKMLQMNADASNRQLIQFTKHLVHESDILLQNLDMEICRSRVEKLHKKESLHRTWVDNVYEPIQESLASVVSTNRLQCIKNWRDQLYEQFLCHTNRRGNVFLDDDNQTVYQAITICPSKSLMLQVHTGQLNDPLNSDVRRKVEEQSLLHQLETGFKPTAHHRYLFKHPHACQKFRK